MVPLEIPRATLVRSNELSLLRPRAARHWLALAAHAHAELLSFVVPVAVSKFGGATEDRDGRENATHELDGVKLDCERDKFSMQSFHLDATTEVRVA